MNLVQLIRRTNGDLLGVALFICLIIYFAFADKQWQEWALLSACSVALVVDSWIVFKTISKA